jgi:uncharacterized surface protein with fasciclin (FAS1) repeats
VPDSWARTLCALIIALACLGLTGCAGSDAQPASTETSAAAARAAEAGSPPATKSSGSSIAVTLDERGLTTMTRIVRAAGLERRLSGAGPYTLVAPDERAFGALPATELSRLCARRDRAKAFVLDQLLAGRVPLEALSDGLLTLTMYTPEGLEEAGHRLTWSVRDAAVEVDGARVTAAVEAANGIVYVVDRPLPSAPEAWARPARASPDERVTVVCRWVDSDGTPVAGARCVFGWHFGDWMPHDEAVTDARGVARCTRVVPAEPGTRRVLVTVTASGPRPTRTVVAAFAVR